MKVAVCEAGPIDALGDAGSRSVFDLIEATRTLGHDVLVVDAQCLARKMEKK
jgi:hypothetical protein